MAGESGGGRRTVQFEMWHGTIDHIKQAMNAWAVRLPDECQINAGPLQYNEHTGEWFKECLYSYPSPIKAANGKIEMVH